MRGGRFSLRVPQVSPITWIQLHPPETNSLETMQPAAAAAAFLLQFTLSDSNSALEFIDFQFNHRIVHPFSPHSNRKELEMFVQQPHLTKKNFDSGSEDNDLWKMSPFFDSRTRYSPAGAGVRSLCAYLDFDWQV